MGQDEVLTDVWLLGTFSPVSVYLHGAARAQEPTDGESQTTERLSFPNHQGGFSSPPSYSWSPGETSPFVSVFFSLITILHKLSISEINCIKNTCELDISEEYEKIDKIN